MASGSTRPKKTTFFPRASVSFRYGWLKNTALSRPLPSSRRTS